MGDSPPAPQASPEEMVVAYVVAVGVCSLALSESTLSVDRASPISPLCATEPSGRRVRGGVIPGVGTYRLHGFGCRFELETGEEVDFDWGPDAQPRFDVWRLQTFARSRGGPTLSDDAIVHALTDLCDRGLLVPVSESFYRLVT